MLLIFKATEPY